MKILLTNDDGFQSEGLSFLASALKKAGHRVLTIAPTGNRSAISRALTTHGDMALVPLGEDAYALGGTPVDCVLVALRFLNFVPDIVLSGINYGGNLGSDTYYSGTLAAAAEGAGGGYPAIALSQDLRGTSREQTRKLLENAAQITAKHLEAWCAMAREAEVLNINFPACIPEKGIRVCSLSRTVYRTSYSEQGGRLRMETTGPEYSGGDMMYVDEGFITITPIRMMGTDDAALAKFGGGHA